MEWLTKYENATEFYMDAQRRWPIRRSRPGGKWILASFDDESIVVYQAYNDEIAQFACENGHFIGCPGYNQQRMTWIKTNFLWMMHRSHWTSRSNKKRILAIWLRRSAFDSYLLRAVDSNSQDLPPDKQSVASNNTDQVRLKGRIRLQWDPDYDPRGTTIPYRRAIQLGLKKVDSFLDGRDILRIVDITSFVKNQYTNAVLIKGHRRRDQLDQLRVPIEHIYEPVDEQIRRHIQLDSWNAT
ncbi:unnamed protein product [Rotaria magnacalcarata]|uniref:Uncharacterized protein n=1 Tax=Rotaria magnacalcarata TaxID=392030 RepID=A0A816PIZ3_9BILA|nr:unnamed protein product [Rotaria magnacalcarata]CAF2067613.1 unnamed protein product [Rotaria magnacalcarata]CAF3976108.1 unnamed protein product [Rotaria magnacalcarata]CAF4177585.1 unnamed protein product [Rotaria magnacalcarata]